MRFPWGNFGINAIQLDYNFRKIRDLGGGDNPHDQKWQAERDKERMEKEKGGRRMVFTGRVFLSFPSEALATLFSIDFDGWMGADSTQYRKGMRAKVARANWEIKTTRTDQEYCGKPRFDEDVWIYWNPSTELAKSFKPEWEKLDRRMARTGTSHREAFEDYYGHKAFDKIWKE